MLFIYFPNWLSRSCWHIAQGIFPLPVPLKSMTFRNFLILITSWNKALNRKLEALQKTMSPKSDRLGRPCCEIQETLQLMSPSPWSPCTSSSWLPMKLACNTWPKNLHVHPCGLHRGKCALSYFITQRQRLWVFWASQAAPCHFHRTTA